MIKVNANLEVISLQEDVQRILGRIIKVEDKSYQFEVNTVGEILMPWEWGVIESILEEWNDDYI